VEVIRLKYRGKAYDKIETHKNIEHKIIFHCALRSVIDMPAPTVSISSDDDSDSSSSVPTRNSIR
jgi:hypothetical protein